MNQLNRNTSELCHLKSLNNITGDQDVLKFKILFLGESLVGKTMFFNQLLKTKHKEIKPSIGISLKAKYFKYLGKYIKIDLWDTAGQEKYKSITKNYIKGANGIFLLYDITDRSTFIKMKDWLKELKNLISTEECTVLIIGNKNDLEDKRNVSFEEGLQFAMENKFSFVETSAFLDINIRESLEVIVKLMISNDKFHKKKDFVNESFQLSR